MYVLLIIIALIAIVLLFPVRLEAEYIFSLSGHKNIFTLKVFGIKVFSGDKKQEPVKKEKTKTDQDGILKKISEIKAMYTALEKDIRDVLRFLKKMLHCKKLIFHIYEGFDDAAVTGFVSGSIYAVVYGLAGIIDENMEIEDLDIQVNPSFDKQRFDIYADSIICVNLVHSISIILRLIRAFYKMKNLNKNTKETENEIPVV